MSRQQPRRLQGRQPTQEVPTGAPRKLCVPVWQELFDSSHSLRWGLKSPDLFRALAELIREPHLTAAFRLDCKYVILAATLSHPFAAVMSADDAQKQRRAWLNVQRVSWAAPCRRI